MKRFVVLFFILLCIPPTALLVATLADQLSSSPEVTCERGFKKCVEKFYGTKWNFRSTLKQSVMGLFIDHLGERVAGNVFFGDNGFLFYIPSQSENTLDDLAGIAAGSKSIQSWVTRFNFVADLVPVGTPIFFLQPPNKSRVYNQYMPGTVHRFDTPDAPHRVFAQKITNRPELSFLLGVDELTDLLQTNSPKTYFKTDTHWNTWGAYVAYRRVAKAHRLPLFTEDRIKWTRSHQDGDIVKMINLNESKRFRSTDESIPELDSPCAKMEVDQTHYQEFTCPSRSGVALVLGDSFREAFAPVVAENYGRTIVLQTLHEPMLESIFAKLPKIDALFVIQIERSLRVTIPTTPYSK